MDSFDWSKTFIVFSISRLSLATRGIPASLVASLTDEDMQAIAEQIAASIVTEPVKKIAEFLARLYIAEKGGSHGNEKPMRQNSET